MEGRFRLRFGVVGTNFITDRIIAAGRLDPAFELTAVCSRTRERADQFAERHAIPHRFTSVDEMAASPFVDAVYIASPNALHAEQTIACLRRGKHVLCEKAFASNAGEARAMIDEARRSGAVLMEAMKPTLTPNFRAVVENLPRLGKPRRYFASFCQFSSRYNDFKHGALPNAFNPEFSTGALMDIGVYTIYPMVALWGRPEKISAEAVKLRSGIDGQGAVNFSYGDMTATVLYSKIAGSSLPFEIQGEEGTLSGDAIHTITKLWFSPPRGGEPVDITAAQHADDYTYEVSEFIGLVRDGCRESTANSLENSLITMEIMDEIRRQAGIVFPADSL